MKLWNTLQENIHIFKKLYMDLCNLQLHNRFYEITKASLALGVRDYTGTIWPNNLYYSTIFSQSRLNGNQFKPEPAAGIFHSCSSLCIAKLCLENLSLEILWFYQKSLRFSNTFCLRVTTSSCVVGCSTGAISTFGTARRRFSAKMASIYPI